MFTVTGISALRSILWIPKKVFIRLLYSTLLCLTELLSWPEPLGETIKDIVLGFCIMWCIQPTEQINHVMHTTAFIHSCLAFPIYSTWSRGALIGDNRSRSSLFLKCREVTKACNC
jgi:hypothetical protein